MFFLKYSSIHKGCRCLCLKTKKIIISRHVKFHENVFPFVHNKESLINNNMTNKNPDLFISLPTSDFPVINLNNS